MRHAVKLLCYAEERERESYVLYKYAVCTSIELYKDITYLV